MVFFNAQEIMLKWKKNLPFGLKNDILKFMYITIYFCFYLSYHMLEEITFIFLFTNFTPDNKNKDVKVPKLFEQKVKK